MASVCVISVINGLINTIWAYYNRRSLLRGVTAFFDIPVFTFVVALEIRAVIIMKRRVAGTENSEVLDQTSAKIIKLSWDLLILFMVCSIPFNMISFIRFLLLNQLQSSSRSCMELFLRLTFFGGYINSTGNALLFLRTSVRSKEYLRNIFGALFQWYVCIKTYENIFVNFSVNKTIPANLMLIILEERYSKM